MSEKIVSIWDRNDIVAKKDQAKRLEIIEYARNYMQKILDDTRFRDIEKYVNAGIEDNQSELDRHAISYDNGLDLAKKGDEETKAIISKSSEYELFRAYMAVINTLVGYAHSLELGNEMINRRLYVLELKRGLYDKDGNINKEVGFQIETMIHDMIAKLHDQVKDRGVRMRRLRVVK